MHDYARYLDECISRDSFNHVHPWMDVHKLKTTSKIVRQILRGLLQSISEFLLHTVLQVATRISKCP